VGWVLAGLTVALSQEPVVEEGGGVGARAGKKKGSEPASLSALVLPARVPGRSPTWLLVTSGVVAAGAFFGASLQLAATFQAGLGGQTVDSVASVLRNPLTPCLLRTQVVSGFASSAPAQVAVPVLLESAALDERCGGMPQLLSQVLLQTNQLEQADAATLHAIDVDPLNQDSWINRAQYLITVDDPAGAGEALDRAEEVTLLNEDRQGGLARIEELRAELTT